MAGNDVQDLLLKENDIEVSNWNFDNFFEDDFLFPSDGSGNFSESSHSNNPIAATLASLLDGSSVNPAECDSSVIITENEQKIASKVHLPGSGSFVGPLSNGATISVSEHAVIPKEYNTFEEQVNFDPSKEYLETNSAEAKSNLISGSNNMNLTGTEDVKSLSAIDESSIAESQDDRHYVLATGKEDKIPTRNESKNDHFIELIDLTEDERVENRNYNSNVNDLCKNYRMSILLDILHDADTEFLRTKIDEIGSVDEFQLFVETSLEQQNYPKKPPLKNTVIRDIPNVGLPENPITVISKQQLHEEPINLSAMGPSTSTANSAVAPHPVTTTSTNAPPWPLYLGFPAPIPHVSHQHRSLNGYIKSAVRPTVNNKPHTVTSWEEATAAMFPIIPKDLLPPFDYNFLNLLDRKHSTAVPPNHDAITPTHTDGANNINQNFTPVDPGINIPVNNRLPAARRFYETINAGFPNWIGVHRRGIRLMDTVRRPYVTRNLRNIVAGNELAEVRALTQILDETVNHHVDNVVSSNPPTIEEQRYSLLADILFCADREFLEKEVDKLKNDEDLGKFLVKSILDEKLWNRCGPYVSNVKDSPKTTSRHTDNKLKILVKLLPDVSPGFLKRESAKFKTDEDLQEFVLRLKSEQIYPKRKSTSHRSKSNCNESKKRKEPNESEQINPKFVTLSEMLPDADPDFLLEQSKSFLSDDELQEFVLKAVEENSYPKREKFVERQEYQKQWNKYIENFDIEQYLQVIANPVKYFYIDKENSKNPLEIPVKFLQHRYRRKNSNDFAVIYRDSENNLTRTCDRLDVCFPIQHRKYTSWDQKTVFSTAVLQEIAFIQNKKDIARFMLLRDELKIIAYKKASAEGTLLECTCCYEEKLSEDMSSCMGGHVYCLDCIKRGSEVVIGNGGTNFPCYTDDCKEEFSLTVLKNVLKAEVFSRVLTRKQYEEVNAAGIPGLESCSFCEFCSIPPPEDKLFHCLNPSCMKITCRFCKKLDHLPLTCEEFERTNTKKKMQSYVEDKMTEALVRTCWQCGTKFVKESGCNMMTCKCGAKMCYFCRKPIKDYSHFSSTRCGQHLDTSAHDEDTVLKVGKKAKMEVENANPGFQLSLDPTEFLKLDRQHRHKHLHHHHHRHRHHNYHRHHRHHPFGDV